MKRKNSFVAFLTILLVGLLPGIWLAASTRAAAEEGDTPRGGDPSAPAVGDLSLFLPLILRNYPADPPPFGVEVSSSRSLAEGIMSYRATTLGVSWVRLNGRISWRALQATQGVPIDWGQLTGFENELRAMKTAGLIPVVTVDDYPVWATTYGNCGALKSDMFDDFASFMVQLVNHFKTAEFNVHHWELGNEPDVDPSLLGSSNSVFGCWGDQDDPYYGGEYYGQMLRVVTPAIRAADSAAKVWIGGLLLDAPQQADPVTKGYPEKFLEGIIRACFTVSPAVDCFDIVPYHWYPHYIDETQDPDTTPSNWAAWGGGAIGKARFLRGVMQSYAIDKPLFLDEVAIGCKECASLPAGFLQAQADFAARVFTRLRTEDIMGWTWYTLNGPGWRNGGLLNEDDSERPVYFAYRTFVQRLSNLQYVAPEDDYGSSIEAYVFQGNSQLTHVLWMKNANASQTATISIPQTKFVAAYRWDGITLSPTYFNGYAQIQVGRAPVYVVRLP